MRTVSALALGFVLFAGTASAQDDNAKKIVGKWEVTKGGSVPVGSTLDFSKDGKVKLTITAKGKTDSLEATYKVEKDRITVKATIKGKEVTDISTIKKLTDDVLELEDMEKKVDELKRVKDKKEK